MNRRELRMSLGTLRFLDAHAGAPCGVLDLRTRPAPKVLVWHPAAIDWIFRSDQRMRHPGSRSLTPLFGRRSLLWADGSRHAAYRQVLGPPLRGRRLAAYRGIIAEAVHSAIDTLVPGGQIALPAWTRRLTLGVMARIVLGRSDDALNAAFTRWIERALGARHRTLAYRYLAGGLPASGVELDERLVRTARSTVDSWPATLAALLLAGDGPLRGIDDAELRDAIVSLLFAGHETTAAAAAWTLYWLDREPRIRQEVAAELAGTDGSTAARVPLLQAVIAEALRLAPPVTVAENRELTGDAELLGRPLPAGTTLTPSIYLAHRDPGRFPDPGRFDPHRFLGDRLPPQHYFPFGGGSRYCLGSQLAQLEIRMITAAVLRRVDWHCVNPRAAVPRLRGHAMAPDPRLRMSVRSCRD
ncbi:MAG TPA: cytochrome P450 [Actinophytocola sp.]|uniref:cytochrome P450 n=1 Tax=Actinophytocola sp. TaxID=1872138 RepID=UPI002DDCEEEC|nr:cytochrome P450 [Actinophytocola sp.]HEV2781777.1 cytochrome P450 [Actinophytocola sp.]